MLSRFARLGLLCALTAVACDRDPVSHLPPLHPVEVAPQVQYAGGSITLKSPRFPELDSLHIFVDTFQLTTLTRADDSVVVQLPRTVRGTYNLTLGRKGLLLGEVEIAGYVGFKPVARTLGDYLDVWPEGGRASVIVGNYASSWDGDVLHLLPATGAVTTLTTGFALGSLGGGGRTPGRTPNPSVVILQPRSGGGAQTWRLLPVARVVDTLPFNNPRHVALFNDSIYLVAHHHTVYTRSVNGWALIYNGGHEETHEVILSPTNDRATLRVNGSSTGVPVFNMVTGDTAYNVRQLLSSYGAAFSPKGDTLWMIGVTPNDYRSSMVMLNARTGTLLKQIFFDEHAAEAMRRAPDGGRIFVFTWDWQAANSEFELLVLDDRTLDVIGRVVGPVCDSWCGWAVIAVGIDGVFVVHPRGIFAFDYIYQGSLRE